MIKSKLTLFALALLAGVAMTATNASAALTYATGDLLMGFRSGGSENYSYIVNLGNISTFLNATPNTTFTVSIGGVTTGALGTDLTNAFSITGSSPVAWSSRTDLYWGTAAAIGAANTSSDSARTIYLSSATATNGGSTAPGNLSASGQSVWGTKIANAGSGYKTLTSLTENGSLPTNSKGIFESNGGTNAWVTSAALGAGSGANYAYGNAFGSPYTVEANVSSSSNKLDLYRVIPTDATFTTPGVSDLGTFSINSAGTVSFTAVPEPSTWTLMGLGLGAVVFAVRRRQLKA